MTLCLSTSLHGSLCTCHSPFDFIFVSSPDFFPLLLVLLPSLSDPFRPCRTRFRLHTLSGFYTPSVICLWERLFFSVTTPTHPLPTRRRRAPPRGSSPILDGCRSSCRRGPESTQDESDTPESLCGRYLTTTPPGTPSLLEPLLGSGVPVLGSVRDTIGRDHEGFRLNTSRVNKE